MVREIVSEEVEEFLRLSSSFSSASSPKEKEKQKQKQLPVLSLNHVSFICRSVRASVKFYEDVLGFVLIKRPSSFNFEGAWLFNHGMGIHLLAVDDVVPTSSKKKGVINPKDNHISFECSDMNGIMKKLDAMGIEYVTAVVSEGGVIVDQLFFHDPDGYMIEICNCQNLPVLPLSSCPINNLSTTPRPPTINQIPSSFYGKEWSKKKYCREVEALMIENLVVDIMDISF